MIRSTWTLAFLLFALVTVPTAASSPNHDPHIRSDEPALVEALHSGARFSPTMSRLVERLEASDAIVYLMFDRAPSRATAGHISLLTASGGRRYLRVSLDRNLLGCERIAILAHELHHAVEIAESRRLRMRRGWRRCTSESGSGPGWGTAIASIVLGRFSPASSSSANWLDVTRN